MQGQNYCPNYFLQRVKDSKTMLKCFEEKPSF